MVLLAIGVFALTGVVWVVSSKILGIQDSYVPAAENIIGLERLTVIDGVGLWEGPGFEHKVYFEVSSKGSHVDGRKIHIRWDGIDFPIDEDGVLVLNRDWAYFPGWVRW